MINYVHTFAGTIESATKSANAARTSDKLSSSEVEIAGFSKGRPPPRRRRKNKVAAAVKIVTPSTDSGGNSEEEVSSGGDPVVSGLVNLINSGKINMSYFLHKFTILVYY